MNPLLNVVTGDSIRIHENGRFATKTIVRVDKGEYERSMLELVKDVPCCIRILDHMIHKNRVEIVMKYMPNDLFTYAKLHGEDHV